MQRVTGEIFKRFGPEAQPYVNRARALLGHLREQMTFSGTSHSHLLYRYDDGVAIRVLAFESSVPGKPIEVVEIYPPQGEPLTAVSQCSLFLESGVVDLRSSFTFGILDPYNLDSYRAGILDTGDLTCVAQEPLAPQGDITFTYSESDASIPTALAVSCRDPSDTESIAFGCTEYTETVQTPTVPPQELTTDADEPDLCVDLYDRKTWANHVPASAFTGKMRLYVQALHGSARLDWRAEETLLEGVWDFFAAGRKIEYLYNIWSKQDLLVTGPDYHYWLLRLEPARVLLQPMQPSACGQQLRQYLIQAIGRGLYQNREERMPLETYLLSTLSPTGQAVDITGQQSGLADMLATLSEYGTPFGPYGWHANWAGSEAAIVVNRPHPDYINNSTQYRHQASLFKLQISVPERAPGFDAADAQTWFTDGLVDRLAITIEEELVVWQPRLHLDHIWYAYPHGGTIRSLPFVPLKEFYNPSLFDCDAPIYCYYDFKSTEGGAEESDELIVFRYQYELIAPYVETTHTGSTSAGVLSTCGCNEKFYLNAEWPFPNNANAGFTCSLTSDFYNTTGQVRVSVIQFKVIEDGLEVPSSNCGGWLRAKRSVSFHDQIWEDCALVGSYTRPCPPESNAWTRAHDRCTFNIWRSGVISTTVTHETLLVVPWLNCDALFLSSFFQSDTPQLRMYKGTETINMSFEAGPRFGIGVKDNCPETADPDCYDCAQWEDCLGYVLILSSPPSCRPPYPIAHTSPSYPNCTEEDTVGPSNWSLSSSIMFLDSPPTRGGLGEQDGASCEHLVSIDYRRIDGGVFTQTGYTPYYGLRESEDHSWFATYPRCREVHLDYVVAEHVGPIPSSVTDILPPLLPDKYRGLYPSADSNITNESVFSWAGWYDFFNPGYFTQPFSDYVIEAHDSLRGAHRFTLPADGPAQTVSPYESLSQTKTTFVGYG